jgi:putative sterol carrier protein
LVLHRILFIRSCLPHQKSGLCGDIQGSCHFHIENGTIHAVHGSAESPDLIIESLFDVWVDIMSGKADGQEMFMTQKYKVKGDLSLLMRMNQIFGKQ